MSKKKQTNSQILLEGVLEGYQESNSLEDAKTTFDFFAIEQISKNLEISKEEMEESIIDSSEDGGIDAVLLFDEKAYFDDIKELKRKRIPNIEIIILQIKSGVHLDENVLRKLKSSTEDIFNLTEDLKKQYNLDFVDKANLIREVWKQTTKKNGKFKVSILYISKAEFKTLTNKFLAEKRKIEKFFKEQKINNEVKLIGADELLDLYRKKKDYSVEIKFEQKTEEKEGRGYTGFVKLSEYYKSITDDGKLKDYIFEENVRDFLNKVKVNEEIMLTLKNNIERRNFWCLNNGITIISSEIRPTGNILHLKNVQIVNGLQTSYQIYKAVEENKIHFSDEDYIIVKVVKTEDRNLRNSIIKATNRQTVVPVAGFRALDKTQIDVEDFLGKNGFYYDRRKNFYKNQNKPIDKIIAIQLLSQIIFSIVYKEPSIARSKPVSLLKDDNNYRKAFGDIKGELWLFLFAINLFKIIEPFSRKLRNKFKADDTKNVEYIVAANYKFHLCRVVMFILMEEDQTSLKDIVKKKSMLEKIIKEKSKIESALQKSFGALVKLAKQYLKDNDKNIYDLISISKNPNFDKEITRFLVRNSKRK